MGNAAAKQTQTPRTSTIIDGTSAPGIEEKELQNTSEDDVLLNELERCRSVHRNIGQLLKEHKDKIHDKYPKFWPAIKVLFDQLSEFSEDLESDCAVNMAVVGFPFEGKSNLINALCPGGRVDVSRSGATGTTELKWFDVSQANLCVLDTVGDAIQDKALRAQLKIALKEKKADVIVIVLSPSTMVIRDALKTLSATVTEMKNLLKSEFSLDPPVLFVLNKVDTYHSWKRSAFTGTWAEYRDYIENNYAAISEEVNTVLEDRFPLYRDTPEKDRILVLTSCENTAEGKDLGISHLTEAVDMKLYRKILHNKMNTYQSFRLSTANKIIASFSSVAGAVGAVPVPGLDVVGIYYLTDMMLQMLSCLAVDPNRSVDQYKKSSRVVIGVLTALRTVGVIASIPLDLTGIALPIGIALGAVSAGGVTAALGWHGYRYFTDASTPQLVFNDSDT